MLLAGCVSTAPTDAPKGAERVIVQTDLAFEDAFRQAGQIITQRGYPVENSDINIGSISTGFHGLGVSPVMVRLNVVVSGNPAKAVFSGEYKSGPSSTSFGIQAAGMSGSPLRQAWAELEAVAQLAGTDISYE